MGVVEDIHKMNLLSLPPWGSLVCWKPDVKKSWAVYLKDSVDFSFDMRALPVFPYLMHYSSPSSQK